MVQQLLVDMQIIFTVLIDAISTVGKNGQQILSAILKQIKLNAKLLTSFTTSGRVESSLINHVQVPSATCPSIDSIHCSLLHAVCITNLLGCCDQLATVSRLVGFLTCHWQNCVQAN